jgi:DNA-binding MarR family transcriptional regulator
MALVLSAFLPYRLSIISEIVSRIFASHYEARFNISIHEWRVIAVLGEAGSLSTQGVIERTQMDRVRVSRAVIRLGDKGIIARWPHPDDQRAHMLRLSQRGTKIYQEIVPLALSLQEQLVELLTPDEGATLDRLLDKLQVGASQLEEHAINGQVWAS